jgi:hypothetical protein
MSYVLVTLTFDLLTWKFMFLRILFLTMVRYSLYVYRCHHWWVVKLLTLNHLSLNTEFDFQQWHLFISFKEVNDQAMSKEGLCVIVVPVRLIFVMLACIGLKSHLSIRKVIPLTFQLYWQTWVTLHVFQAWADTRTDTSLPISTN